MMARVRPGLLERFGVASWRNCAPRAVCAVCAAALRGETRRRGQPNARVDAEHESAYVGDMDGAREVAWAVMRSGCLNSQIAADYGALVEDIEGSWKRLFPRRLGYSTQIEAPSEHLVRLHVRRGDFEGSVDLCCEWRRGDAAQIRAVALAESARLRSVQASGERTVRRARVIATCVGASIGLAFCWLAAGVQMPVVGGLMLSIIMACLLIGGGNLGARVGEGLASRRRDNAERAVQADPSVQADIRRWNSLNRQLRGHRRALVRGMSGAPFRREAS